MSRRTNLAPRGWLLRMMGHPLTVAFSYLIFVSSLFLHAFLIWQDALPRRAALVTGLVAVVMTVILLWEGRPSHRKPTLEAPAQG